MPHPLDSPGIARLLDAPSVTAVAVRRRYIEFNEFAAFWTDPQSKVAAAQSAAPDGAAGPAAQPDPAAGGKAS